MSTQIISGFEVPKQFGVMVRGGKHKINPERTEALKRGEAQLVDDNLRWNITPLDMEGKPYTGNDPRVGDPGSGSPFYKQDDTNNGKSPIVEVEYGYEDKDGKEVLCSNSTDREDIWALNSYEDSGGCTPNLLLNEPAGSGTFRAFIRPYVRAQYNGGVEVKGPRAFWNID